MTPDLNLLPKNFRKHIRSQITYARVNEWGKLNPKIRKKLYYFAIQFPRVIHFCGLAPAVAYAVKKKFSDYLEDLFQVMNLESEHNSLLSCNSVPLSEYLELSRRALESANLIKHYCEMLSNQWRFDPSEPEEAE